MRPIILLALLLSGCGVPGGMPLVSTQSPPASFSLNAEPQPPNSLPPGAAGVGPGFLQPTYLSRTFHL